MGLPVENQSSIDLLSEVESLARESFDAYLSEITASIKLENCQATAHCKFLLSDGNGRPRVNDLARKLASHMVDYAIPRSKKHEAAEYYKNTGSVSKFYELQTQAKSLFTSMANTGEGGEALLYLLTETYLKIPQVICKMSLKTSGNVHFHGSDGVHAKYDKDKKKLALYWCESKLYSKVTDGISNCFESIAPFLTGNGGSFAPQDRDLHLLRDHVDLLNEDLEDAFVAYLDPDSKSFNNLEFRGICLIGFDSNLYPTLESKKENEQLRQELEGQVANWTKNICKHISKNKLATFDIEVFCLPFPDVEDFRKSFLKELGHSV